MIQSPLVDLIINTHNIGGDELAVKDKVLYLIGASGSLSPSFLTQKLHIAKSNIAKLCKQLIMEKLIYSRQDIKDKRIIFYSLTDIGEQYMYNKTKQYIDTFNKMCEEDKKKIDEVNIILNKESL